jgi:hypothetical protein
MSESHKPLAPINVAAYSVNEAWINMGIYKQYPVSTTEDLIFDNT